MSPTPFDHLFVLLLLVVQPAFGAWQFRRLKARLAAGEQEVRVRQYRTIMVEELLLVGIVAALWATFERPWTALAPETPAAWEPWGPWIGWTLAGIVCVLLVVQVFAVARSGEGRARVREQLEGLDPFLPHDERELRTFRVLSVSAGIGEEIVFRGFALAWATAAAAGLGLGVGASLWVAALGSSVLFGLVHAYQGPAGIVRTGATGLGLAGLALATGGLLAPIVVHAVLDLASGQAAFLALREEAPDEVETASA